MIGETGSASKTGYLPGLDGLRALAVIAVIAYHADPHWLPGGFLGVEIFFVISGFIITRGLVAEWRQTGRIELRSFWRRRALRLLPALFLLLTAVLGYAVLFEPSLVAELRIDALAALAYVTNWRQIFADQSYFASWEQPSLLRHLWSLAIEEQFYLVWPVLLSLMLAVLRRPKLVIACTLLLAFAAYANMAYQYQALGESADASRIYYGSDARIGALLLGACLGFLPPLMPHAPGSSRIQVLGLAGLVSLGLLAFYAVQIDQNDAFLYQGGFLVTSLATTSLILMVASSDGLAVRALGIAPLRWLGARSYGVYLWHWPIFLLSWPAAPDLPLLFPAQVTASIVIAALSYRFLEQPLRHGALGRIWEALGREQPRSRLQVRRGLALAGGGFAVVLLSYVALAPAATPPAALARSEVRITNASALLTVSDVASRLPGSIAESEQQSLVPSPLSCSEDEDPIAFRGYGESEPVCLQSPALSPTTVTVAATATPPATTKRGRSEKPQPTQTAEPPPPPTPTEPAGRVVSPPEPLSPDQVEGLLTAIGDSVMLGAVNELVSSIPNIDVDAAVGRQVSSAIGLLWERQQAGQLGNTVVLHLGNNGSFSTAQFDDIMAVVGPDRQVIFLNVRVPRDWESPNNQVITEGVARYANAVLADWYTMSGAAADVFISDQVHLQRAGAWLYVQAVQTGLSSLP